MAKRNKQGNESELFDQFVVFLKQNGLTVEEYKNVYESFRTCIFKGMGIRGMACELSDPAEIHADVNGKMVFDNKKCFDKFTRCPISLPLPENEDQRAYVLEQMKFWGSKDGYEKSNGFDYEQIEDYPRLKTAKNARGKDERARAKIKDTK